MTLFSIFLLVLLFVFTALIKVEHFRGSFLFISNWFMRGKAKKLLPSSLYSFYNDLDIFKIPFTKLSEEQVSSYISSLHVETNHFYVLFHQYSQHGGPQDFFALLNLTRAPHTTYFSFSFDFSASIETNNRNAKKQLAQFIEELYNQRVFYLLKLKAYYLLKGRILGLPWSAGNPYTDPKLNPYLTNANIATLDSAGYTEIELSALDVKLKRLDEWRKENLEVLEKRLKRQIKKGGDFFFLLDCLNDEIDFIDPPECYFPPFLRFSEESVQFQHMNPSHLEKLFLEHQHPSVKTKKRSAL